LNFYYKAAHKSQKKKIIAADMMKKMQDEAIVINLNIQLILGCVKIKNNNKRRK
jgi:hypothetical protein